MGNTDGLNRKENRMRIFVRIDFPERIRMFLRCFPEYIDGMGVCLWRNREYAGMRPCMGRQSGRRCSMAVQGILCQSAVKGCGGRKFNTVLPDFNI